MARKLHNCTTCRFGWLDFTMLFPSWFCECRGCRSRGEVGRLPKTRCRSWVEEFDGQEHDNWRECVSSREDVS